MARAWLMRFWARASSGLPFAAVLILLGTGIRLWAVPWARFTGDEAAFWDTARAIAALERFPVLGPEITGTSARLPGAAFHYLTALPQLFGASPYWGGGFIALLHVGAGLLLARFAGRARGNRAMVLALVIWAFAPWDILYADRIWASCLAPVLGATALYSADRAQEDARWLTLTIFVLLLLPQVHLSAPIVWAAVAVLLFLKRPKGPVRSPSLAGLALGAALYLPFLVVELRSGFANTRAILERSGGTEEAWAVALVPVKVLGYAIIYATGELGYHFERGYWGGAFDELAAYGTGAGWSSWWGGHGLLLGLGVLLSVFLAVLGWLLYLTSIGWALLRPRKGEEPRISRDAAMGLAVLAGLAVGAVLMMAARKSFFPHYANVLMPFALWPAVSGLDRWARLGRFHACVVFGLAVSSAAAMATNTLRYYREVDALNGLSPTIGMVERALAASPPVNVRFAHFHNLFAWQKLAHGYFGTGLDVDPRALDRFIVHNRPDSWRGRQSSEGEWFGPVFLEHQTTDVPSFPEDVVLAARRDWKTAEVYVRGAQGLGKCRPERHQCRYGPHPWQRFGPQGLTFGGQLERVVFMHPVSNATVAARFAVPPSAVRGTLRFGLTDEAHRSTNRVPVQVVLRSSPRSPEGLSPEPTQPRPGKRTLLRTQTSTDSGLREIDFNLGPVSTLSIEITTENDGARVFGFDLWLKSPPSAD